MKSDDFLKREFKADKPCKKCVTDITEIKGKDGKLYTSVIFDCFDLTALGLSMDTNMKAELCVEPVKNAVKSYPELKGAILHSDRGSQYTSEKYREALKHAGFVRLHQQSAQLQEETVVLIRFTPEISISGINYFGFIN